MAGEAQEFAGGEGFEGAEASDEFGGVQPAVEVEHAEKVVGAALCLGCPTQFVFGDALVAAVGLQC